MGFGVPTVDSVTGPGAARVWLCQRSPNRRRRMAQLPDENERPLLSVLTNLGARRRARLVVFSAAHRFFLRVFAASTLGYY